MTTTSVRRSVRMAGENTTALDQAEGPCFLKNAAPTTGTELGSATLKADVHVPCPSRH
jgi:hypothetical protein